MSHLNAVNLVSFNCIFNDFQLYRYSSSNFVTINIWLCYHLIHPWLSISSHSINLAWLGRLTRPSDYCTFVEMSISSLKGSNIKQFISPFHLFTVTDTEDILPQKRKDNLTRRRSQIVQDTVSSNLPRFNPLKPPFFSLYVIAV